MQGLKKLSFKRILYSFQEALKASVFIIIILTFFSFDLIHLTAIASSSFAAFCFPNLKTAQTRHLLGSYFVAIIIGMFFSFLYFSFSPNIYGSGIYIFGGLIVLFSAFLMILFTIEHPPAVGAAFAFLAHHWTWKTPTCLMVSIILLVLYRWGIKWIQQRIK